MTKTFTHALTLLACVIVSLVWLTPFVERVLAVLWPIVAAALAVLVVCSALALSFYLLSLGVRSVRTPAAPVEVFTPAPLTTFARDVAAAFTQDDSAIHTDRWNVAITQFCFVGDRVGFSVRSMLPYISRTKRDVYVSLLTTHPPARPVLADYGQGTQWSRDWNYYGLRAALKHHALSLPYPDMDPPAVLLSKPGEARTAHTAHTPSTASTPLGVTYLSPMSGD